LYKALSKIKIMTIVDCHPPPNIEHGQLHYNTTLFGDVVNVVCDVGYTANFDVINCTSRATWSDYPKCKPAGKRIINISDHLDNRKPNNFFGVHIFTEGHTSYNLFDNRLH